MASFTLTDDRTEVSKATMHTGGTKRLHLAGVGGDRSVLSVDSTNSTVVSQTLLTLFSGPKGIWTVDLQAKSKGSAEVQAKLKGAVVATIAVTVVEKLALPAEATEEGMLARLLLAEALNPGQQGYDASKSKTAMQWMRIVLANRLNSSNPEKFYAKGAKTLADIVKARPEQFKGFQDYPKIGADQSKVIGEVLNIANADSDRRQEKYAQFVQNALEAASSKALISDPCPTGLYGWRTAGSDPPGGDFVKYGDPQSGNQFYTLSK
jgi:hypothetical protein